MKFDARKLKNPPRPRSKKNWDLRSYKPRKNKFSEVKALRGQTITKDVIKIFGEEIVKAVKEEAKKASGKGAGIPMDSEGDLKRLLLKKFLRVS